MFAYLPFLLCSFVVTQAATFIGSCPPSVITKYGAIEGKWGLSIGGRRYAIFEGIPYAKPPVGELRFEEPQPIEAWNGTWKATRVNRCIQRFPFIRNGETIGDEDCLYLNIYVPVLRNDLSSLDVVIHIHGGAFQNGYGKGYTDDKYVMDRDIIFATIHYRLDALGFLSTGDEVVPGNNGLKDQNLAMKWIKENIMNFGGNPESVTLTGFSAGAASVHYHYLSPLSRNLFQRGMSFSGTALNAFALQKFPDIHARKLAGSLGCDTSDNKLMVNCMKTRPAHLIIKTSVAAVDRGPMYPFPTFTPVIENGSTNPFLPEHPYVLLKEGRIYDVPLIVSTTSHEGALFSIPLMKHFEYIEKNWERDAKYMNNYFETLPQSKETEIAERIRNFYFSEDKMTYEELTKMFTDRVIRVDSTLAVQMQSKVNKSPVYFLAFGYDSPQGLKTKIGNIEYKGSCHGDDMPYFFGGFVLKPLTPDEIKLQKIALDLLHSYAHNGKPSISNITWLRIGKEFNFLNISGPDDIRSDVKTDFSTENFWSSLGLLENENLFLDESSNEV